MPTVLVEGAKAFLQMPDQQHLSIDLKVFVDRRCVLHRTLLMFA
jgi:hypothetical protein